MTDTAPVTVVTPVRNAAAHLAAALESVLAQAPPPAEVFVVDGNSTDSSVAIAAGFPQVRVIHQTSTGLAAARNEAIRASGQPFIAFCDADDRWTENSLAARMQALAADPEALAVIGDVVLEVLEGIDATSAQQNKLGQVFPGFTPGAMLARREAFDRIGGFDESLTVGTDSEWFVRLYQHGFPPLQIKELVLRKGANGASLSTDVAKYRRELLTVARRFIDGRRRNAEL